MPGKELQLVVQDVMEDGSALFSGSCVRGLTVTATRYHLGGGGPFFACFGFHSCRMSEASILKLVIQVRSQPGWGLTRAGTTQSVVYLSAILCE